MNRIARKQILVPIFAVLITLIVSCTTNSPAAPASLPTVQAVAAATTTASPIPTQTETATSTTLSTSVPTLSPSATPQPPTNTPTSTSTDTVTPSPTATPSPTETSTATPLSVATEIVTETPALSGVETAVSPSSPANPSTAISLADLPNHLGAEVTVSGQVVSAASFSQGFKFTLDDGTGRADLLLWHDVYDEAWDAPQLNVGSTVQATGKVGQFDGAWQVEPDFGGDVQVTTPGSGAAPARAIGELAGHVGETAQISGTILRLEGAGGSGVKIFVGDDTGEIVVFVWRTILDRIPNNVALGEPGTNVRINGRVENYRSNLELVPALPYDVEVLP